MLIYQERGIKIIKNYIIIQIITQRCFEVNMSETLEEQLEAFHSNLNLIKSMKDANKAQDQFYNLMNKAKNAFGQNHLYMAEFYYEYGNYLLKKMEENVELFNMESLPVPGTNGNTQDVIEQVADSSSQGSIEEENNVNEINETNKVVHQGQNVIITEQVNKKPKDEKIQEKIQNEIEAKKEGNEVQKENEGESAQQGAKKEQEEDDSDICASHFLCSISIYQKELDKVEENEGQGKYTVSELKRFLSRAKSRLGDLYHINEQYMAAVDIYREVITEEEKKEGHQYNRPLAELHYLIANSFLYENKEGCQIIAIGEFIKSVEILISHLRHAYPEDTSTYQIPSTENPKVDRFTYLPKPTDPQLVKELKEVLSCLLDKIEDTHGQIAVRGQYEQEKKKSKQVQESIQFKEVTDQTNVKKLGTFGNRKKMPKVDEEDPKKE